MFGHGERNEDRLLSALLDGELNGVDARYLRDRIVREPRLAERLEALRAADAAVQIAYVDVGHLLAAVALARFEILLRACCVDTRTRPVCLDGAYLDRARGPRDHTDAFGAALRPIDLIAARLPREQRRVLALITVERFSYLEAARALGLSIETIVDRLAVARAQVLASLENESASDREAVRLQ